MADHLTESDYLLQQIGLIQEAYQKQIQPYVERLARLKAVEQPRVMYLTADQLVVIQKFNHGHNN